MDFSGVSVWFWVGLSLALFAAETIVPGAFMLWLGFAAAGSALVRLLFPELPLFWQWIVFAVFAFAATCAGWQWRKAHPPKESDQPALNRRVAQIVGVVVPLDSAIENGRGRVKIGDAFWQVEGPDLPAGTPVRIDGVHPHDSMLLRVRPA
jgi:membrane protein implicated in regulation of membrane protease activity